jgi:AcrR family transcriptional regulator
VNKDSDYTRLGVPRTTRQQQALARREQIVEAALGLFAQQGFDGTSTKHIAQVVGVTEGLVFHYFPTKADLLTAVLETHHSFLNTLRSILAEANDQPASVMLPRIATGWLKTLRREAAITAVLLGTAQTNPQVGETLHQVIRVGITLLATYLRTRVQAGELRADLSLETSAHLFFSSLIIFFVTYRSLTDTAWDARVTTFVQEMLSVWFTGART